MWKTNVKENEGNYEPTYVPLNKQSHFLDEFINHFIRRVKDELGLPRLPVKTF